jgi:hypothetical protein
MRPLLLSILLLLSISLHAQALPGSYPVGYRDMSFIDNTLADTTVMVKVFYPGTAAGVGVPVSGGTFPVIAFGHGFNMAFDDYDLILAHVASYGFIVVTPNVQNGFSVSHAEFAREMSACIRWVWSESANVSSEFYNRADTACGVFGHSMGGGASGLVPNEFPTIDAISGFAAAETTPSAIAALASYAGPFQAISGSEDNVAPEGTNQQLMYNAATGTKNWVSITGGAHCKFSDGTTICDLVSGAGSITREEQIRLSKRYATAFFRYHLQHDTTAMVFLCGDSTIADIAANKILVENTFGCNLVSSLNPIKTTFEVYPNPATESVTVRSTEQPQILLPDGRTLHLHWTRAGEEWTANLRRAPRGILLVQVPGQSGTIRLIRQ